MELISLLPTTHLNCRVGGEGTRLSERGREQLGVQEGCKKYSRHISPLTDISNVAFLERIQFALISFYSKPCMNGHESAVKVSRPWDETDRLRAVPPSCLLTRNITLAMLRKSTEDKIKTQSLHGSEAGPIFAFAQSL